MMLLLEVIFDRSVGGDRMLMSIAVPRRRGTSGVSSIEMSGRDDRDDRSDEFEFESGVILKASMSPGLTTMLHSSGVRLSQLPLSDQPNRDATTLLDLAGCTGTVRYPLWDAELEGERELVSEVAVAVSWILGLGSSDSSSSDSEE